MSNTVVFVDDDPSALAAIQRSFRKEPYEIFTAQTPEQGLSLLQSLSTDVVVVDQNMPGMSGLEFLSLAREVSPETFRIMLTGEASLSLAVDAINRGEIFRFFTKPYNEIEFGISIRLAIQQARLIGSSCRALEVMKMQAAYIDSLERTYAGISRVERDETGTILIKDSSLDLNQVINELEAEISSTKEFKLRS